MLQKLEIKAIRIEENTEQDDDERETVPGSDIESISEKVLKQEEGPHIAAFFDLDRTLIDDFSAKKFLQSRVFSGKSTSKELFSQFATVLLYSIGNRDFEVLTKVSALGIKGIREKEFVNLGKVVYEEHLADSIYPESRKLIASHLEQGHRVVIVSAATIYQIRPIADELGIEDVFCTEMEVKKGHFTGKIEEMCWGEGKARAGK